jgi:hypothetical protein
MKLTLYHVEHVFTISFSRSAVVSRILRQIFRQARYDGTLVSAPFSQSAERSDAEFGPQQGSLSLLFPRPSPSGPPEFACAFFSRAEKYVRHKTRLPLLSVYLGVI